MSEDELIRKAVEAGELAVAREVENRLFQPVYNAEEIAIRAAAPIFREAYYDQGHADGQALGVSIGQSEQYDQGLNAGYQVGFQEGREAAAKAIEAAAHAETKGDLVYHEMYVYDAMRAARGVSDD